MAGKLARSLRVVVNDKFDRHNNDFDREKYDIAFSRKYRSKRA